MRVFGISPGELDTGALQAAVAEFGLRVVEVSQGAWLPLPSAWYGPMPSLADSWSIRRSHATLEGVASENKPPLELVVSILEAQGWIVDRAECRVTTNNLPEISMFDGLVGICRGMIHSVTYLKLLELRKESA